MDPVSLILTALATGATMSASGALDKAGKDVYDKLKNYVKGKLDKKKKFLMEEFEEDPEIYEKPMEKAIQQANISLDKEFLNLVREKILIKAKQNDTLIAIGTNAQAIKNEIENLTIYIQQTAESLSANYEELFLKNLIARSENLPWISIDPEFADFSKGESPSLSDVYTALDTTELEKIKNEAELRHFLKDIEKRERISAQQMLNNEKHLLILGDPGSGKSTFVKFVSIMLAKARLSDEPNSFLKKLNPWDHGSLFPVPVILREFGEYLSEQKRGNARLILDFLEENLKDWKVGRFWENLNNMIHDNNGDLLIMFDGLDEVPKNFRKIVVDSVNDFVATYQQHRYLVTCRPYAYIDQPHRLHNFSEVTLAPFSEDQIDFFVDSWYGEIIKRKKFHKKEADKRASKLKKAVKRQDLQGMAQWPLLLTVMTILHTWRGELPDDRVELYDWTIDLLLRRWEGRLGEEDGILEKLNIPGLKKNNLEAALFEVAYKAHEQGGYQEGTANIKEGDLITWIAPHLGNDLNKAKIFADYIRERAGLLIRHKTDAYTFPHRSFQEFLAACHIATWDDFSRDAAQLVKDDYVLWREVFVLAVGRAARQHRKGAAISAVNYLCPNDFKQTKNNDQNKFILAMLAGEALLEIGKINVESDELGKALAEKIFGLRGWLVTAMQADKVLEPKQRVESGNILSRWGDPRPGITTIIIKDTELPDILWCHAPAGKFWMGEDKEEHQLFLNEFYISRYPVTNAQFNAFVKDNGYGISDYWQEAMEADFWKDGRFKGKYDKGWRDKPNDYGEPFTLANHPVVGVSWYEALAFCRWLDEKFKELGKEITVKIWDKNSKIIETKIHVESWHVTLPSEAEWEKAARSDDKRLYPWGNDITPNHANYNETGINASSPAGCFPAGASPYGMLDMSGNVWEWTRSLYKDYKYDSEDGREDLQSTGVRVLRGGSFLNLDWGVRCAFRFRSNPINWDFNFGFRIILSPF